MRRALALSAMFLLACPSPSYFCQTTWQAEWTQRQETAKKEGEVIFSIPPSAELRKALEDWILRLIDRTRRGYLYTPRLI
jgi:hypothetical protein